MDKILQMDETLSILGQATNQLQNLVSPQIAETEHLCEVMTWGDPDSSGDSSKVQEHLRNVQQIQATDRAFGAILEFGIQKTAETGARCKSS